MLTLTSLSLPLGFTPYDQLFLTELGVSLAMQAGIIWDQLDNQTLVFNGTALQEDYQEVLAEVFFQNLADEPGNVEQTVSFFITDGVFNDTSTTTVQIRATNDPALFSFIVKNLTFFEQTRDSVSLFAPEDTLSDADGTDILQWVTVEITPNIDSMDMLDASSTSNELNIDRISSALGNVYRLNISGEANFSVYEEILRTVTFSNNFPGINDTTRNIEVVTFDGLNESPPHVILLNIITIDDPPMCYFGSRVRLGSTGAHKKCFNILLDARLQSFSLGRPGLQAVTSTCTYSHKCFPKN